MPTREAIVDTVLPQGVAKPIPVRTITTRTQKPKTNPDPAAQTENRNQPATVVDAPAAVSATTEETVRLSPQLSALARKEQAFHKERESFKAQQGQFGEKLKRADAYDQLVEKLKSKDFSVLEGLGLSYEEYTQFLLAKQGGEDPNAQKISALEKQIADLKKGQEESATDAYEATVAEYRKEITQAVASNPDFSSIKHFGEEGEKAVLQLILDSWSEDELEVSVEQACKDIEAELVEGGKKFTELPKLKPKPAQTAESQAQLPPPKPSVNTLTNTMQPPSGEVTHRKSLQHLSESERYAEARRRVLERRAQQQGT